MSTESSTDESKEQRILRMVKKVLTDVAKDTYTPPELRHPLSGDTINAIRECLALITTRENELGASSDKPHFIDEPQTNVVVQLDSSGLKDEK